MAVTYRYIAHTLEGKRVEGVLEGENEKRIANILRSQGYFVSSIKPAKERKSILSSAKIELYEKRVGLRELVLFSRQLATMIDAGLPLLDTLFVLQQQTDNRYFRHVMQGVIENLNRGLSLSKAMEQYPKVFPNLFISMIEAGETGGILDTVLERIAVYYEKELDMREKLKGALIYPCFVLAAAFGVTVFLLVKVVPKFLDVFGGMNIELPLPTLMLISLSNGFVHYWYAFIFSGLAIIGVGFLLLRTRRGKYFKDIMLLKLPVVGRLLRQRITARFCRTFATLISSGVPVLEALSVLMKVSGNQIIAHGIGEAQKKARKGEGISEQLGKSRIFPPMVIRMMAVGEGSGTMDLMLNKAADFYDRETDNMVSRMTTLIEPALIFVLGGIVAFIMLSVFTPILKMVTTF